LLKVRSQQQVVELAGERREVVAERGIDEVHVGLVDQQHAGQSPREIRDRRGIEQDAGRRMRIDHAGEPRVGRVQPVGEIPGKLPVRRERHRDDPGVLDLGEYGIQRITGIGHAEGAARIHEGGHREAQGLVAAMGHDELVPVDAVQRREPVAQAVRGWLRVGAQGADVESGQRALHAGRRWIGVLVGISLMVRLSSGCSPTGSRPCAGCCRVRNSSDCLAGFRAAVLEARQLLPHSGDLRGIDVGDGDPVAIGALGEDPAHGSTIIECPHERRVPQW